MKAWPASERPRERLYSHGPAALADAELLALQLGSGTRGRSAVDVAREMLAAYGSLADVAGREVGELAHVAGVGPAKAARLVAMSTAERTIGARSRSVRGALRRVAGSLESMRTLETFASIIEGRKLREKDEVARARGRNGVR